MHRQLIGTHKYIILLLLCSLVDGCASLVTHGANYSAENYEPVLYSGTRLDIKIIEQGVECSFNTSCSDDAYAASLAPFSLLDLPFSALLDTVLLPIDATMYYKSN